ncbi:hypothetical protein ANANG_G00013900 [Anguilla anguilla]|uniref:Cadherin domain-containing protein n=2 Tax=Anguilla anguilla TaxID=7936 RepID=A0A9D3N0C8_ANGAN|nr:hypothetical protein ANANG_G00013900 [Anguilla anguilla]
MLPTPYLMALALLIGRAVGEGWEDRIGAMGDKVLEVPEGTEVPYPIFQFKSAQPEVMSYQVTGQTSGKISISKEGWLYLVEPLNWAEESTHNLQIEAHGEIDTEIVDGPYSVTINVKDINNHPPVFSLVEYHGEVMERTSAGEPFMRVSATDLDNPDTPNAKLSYSIVNQIPDRLKKPLFQINSVTGEISITPDGEEHLSAKESILYGMQVDPEGSVENLKKKFAEYCTPIKEMSYELNPFFTCVERSESKRMNPADEPDYILIVRVQDLEGASENAFSANAKVTVVVKQNLWRSPGPVTIRENLEAEYPMKIAQVQSNNPGALYKLGQKERFPKFPFSINEGGEIFVTESLDREEKDTYVLVVFAQDGEGTDLEKPMEIPVIVEDVNDNPPMCEKEESVLEVQENEAMGSQIGALGAYDLDEEINSLLSYQLLTQQPIPSSGSMFNVDGLSGTIQIRNTLPKRKEIPEYRLTVKISDQAGAATGLSNECKMVIKVIDINNEIPVFEKNDYGTTTTPEDTPPGTVLLSVLATDADDPGTGSSKVEYHITDGDQDGMFAIDAEGNIYVAKPLDFESKSTFRLRIDAKNPEPLVPGVEYDSNSTAFVSIEVTGVDELPEFDTDIFEVSVPENATVGAPIVKMDAKDPEGKEIRYKLEGDEHNWLEINAETGQIKTKAKLDHEEVAVISVKVTAYEKESPERAVQKDVTVRILDVNDNVPKLTENQAFICRKKITPVFLYAEDRDSPPFGKPFTFVIAQPKKFLNWQIETVDDTSAKLVLKKAPDDEKTFILPINVKDNAGVGVSNKFEVRVCNCTELGYCYMQPEAHAWKYGMPTTVAILAGTFGFIAVILIVVVHRSNKNKQKRKAKEADDTDAML